MQIHEPPSQPPRSGGLAARGLRPLSELAASRSHGHRLRYMAGCRCSDCRAANTAYERNRAQARKNGDWNGNVSAAPARAHLAALSAQSVGRRTVGDVTGIADSVLTAIIAGTKLKIRARTERAILAVTPAAAADRALVPARQAWRLINELRADGYSKAELARQLGMKTPALQIGRTMITVRTDHDVKRLHARLGYCEARKTLKLLEQLREEGYSQSRIQAGLVALARERTTPAPRLEVRQGRIKLQEAALVARLHAQWLGEQEA